MLKDTDVHLLTMSGERISLFVVPAMHDGGARRPTGGITILGRDQFVL